MRVACKVMLSDDERKALIRWSRGKSTAARLVFRATIVLLASEGMKNKEIAAHIGTSRQSVGLWRSRFIQKRLAGIEKDAPGRGRKPTKRNRVVRLILERTTQTVPANATHWSVRTLAKELKVNPTMVHRIWKANGLKPHLIRTFKVSNDP